MLVAFAPSVIFGAMWAYSMYTIEMYITTTINTCATKLRNETLCLDSIGAFPLGMLFVVGVVGGIGIAIAPTIIMDLVPEDEDELPDDTLIV